MNILALQLGHNATVLLLQDGVVKHIVSQERFDNIKNSAAFPVDAIRWILKQNQLTEKDVHKIAVCGEVILPHYLAENNDDLTHRKSKLYKLFGWVDYYAHNSVLIRLYSRWQKNKLKKNITHAHKQLREKLEQMGLNSGICIEYVPHHTCHTYSPAFFFEREPQEEWLILTMDGAGDDDFATVNILGKDGKIECIAKSPWEHSVGYVYNLTTHFLGMKRLEHEYKVMGLAAYAKPDYFLPLYERVFKPAAWLNPENPLEFRSAFPLNRFDLHLRAKAVGERFDNVAGALQHFTEDMVLSWVRAAIEKTGIHNVMVSGGVFMNVKVNKLIQEIPEVEKIKFMPSCGDESNPFGGAFYVANENGEKITPCNDIYLGHAFSNEDVEQFINEKGLKDKYAVSKEKNIAKSIAKLLSNFKVVARVYGGAEFGARSLGNRAILANPSDMRSFYMVNDQIKVRDFWMPFAPSMLDTYVDKYLKNFTGEAPFMITAFDLTDVGKEELRAAMHQGDHTARPQVVKEAVNPEYYQLIKEFEKLTGIGGVMNTSFNLHGYPMASTLEQALFTFENSGLEYLALQDFIVAKKS